MNKSTITPFNKLPVIIKEKGIYLLRNGGRALIHEVQENKNKEVTAFTCKGSVERMFRGKKRFKGYKIWHESGMGAAFESDHDIVAFIQKEV